MDTSVQKSSPIVKMSSNDAEKNGILIDRDADLGLQHLVINGTVEYTEAEEAAVRWKIDLCLLPIVSEALS